ncbi:MAG: C39 family peptidase [Chloroflexota bacterium]
MTPSSAYGRRQPEFSAFVPVLLAVAALITLVATMPLSGVQVPGTRRLQAALDRIPQPWKPPRPIYVPPPEVAPPAEPNAAIAARPAPSSETAATAQPVEAAPSAPPVAAAPAVPAPANIALPPPPAAFRMEHFRHQYQTWNNCGPATITMATSHFGRTETQAQAAPYLKPSTNDKNVSPDELVAYVRSVGLHAEWRVAGDLDRLKLLLANGVPVVVETWFTPHPNDGMGHYRLLVGYDDAARRFLAYDSYQPPGVNVALPYGPFDADWRVFNRTYVPVYPAEKVEVVDRILGPDGEDQAMWERSLAVAQQEIAARPNDAFAWFNAGSSLVGLGRTAEAVPAFDRARSLKLPWRMLWYQFAPFEAYLTEGRLNDVLVLTGANLQQAGDLEESHYYRGRALQAQGQTAAARTAYQAAVRYNSRYTPAYHALSTLG